VLALVASPVVAGCAQGSDAGSRRRPRSQAGDLARSAKTRREGAVKDRPLAVDAVLSFTADLHQRLAADPGNVVSSPYSVAVALAMSRNGARGQTASEMDDVLHAPELGGLNGGLNVLTALIEPSGQSHASRRQQGHHLPGRGELTVGTARHCMAPRLPR
jgi:serpin B